LLIFSLLSRHNAQVVQCHSDAALVSQVLVNVRASW